MSALSSARRARHRAPASGSCSCSSPGPPRIGRRRCVGCSPQGNEGHERHGHRLQPFGRGKHAPDARSALPSSVRRILMVGGGTAGWMTALILARSLIEQGVEITVVESPTVGIIGVGEGSTPWLRGFFDSLNIEEAEWMPECHATYKCGITFDGWSTKPGYASYFHPFASMLDNLTMTQFVHNTDARVNGADVARIRTVSSSRRAWPQASGAQTRRTFPLRHLARISLRRRAVGPVPAQKGLAARRALSNRARDSRESR